MADLRYVETAKRKCFLWHIHHVLIRLVGFEILGIFFAWYLHNIYINQYLCVFPRRVNVGTETAFQKLTLQMPFLDDRYFFLNIEFFIDFLTHFSRNGSTEFQSFVYYFVENLKLFYTKLSIFVHNVRLSAVTTASRGVYTPHWKGLRTWYLHIMNFLISQ